MTSIHSQSSDSSTSNGISSNEFYGQEQLPANYQLPEFLPPPLQSQQYPSYPQQQYYYYPMQQSLPTQQIQLQLETTTEMLLIGSNETSNRIGFKQIENDLKQTTQTNTIEISSDYHCSSMLYSENEMICFKRVGQDEILDELRNLKDEIFDRYDTWDSENNTELKIILMAFDEIRIQLQNIDEKE